MSERKSTSPVSQRVRSNPAGELLVRCGEIVEKSGIYEELHESHELGPEPIEIVAIRGEMLHPCKTCGDQVRWRLLYGAPHVSEDEDFVTSA